MNGKDFRLSAPHDSPVVLAVRLLGEYSVGRPAPRPFTP